jgi:hypothetical protein
MGRAGRWRFKNVYRPFAFPDPSSCIIVFFFLALFPFYLFRSIIMDQGEESPKEE